MKKTIKLISTIFLVFSVFFIGNATAKDKYYYYSDNGTQTYEGKHKSRKRGKMDINLAAVPTSINGTYEIDRLIIKNGEKMLLDSENDFAVVDHRGFMTLNMTVGKDIILETVYNMQMAGPAFQNPELKSYEFLYDNKTWTIPHNEGELISTSLASVGITVYDREDIYLDLPFEDGKRLLMKIEKETDFIMQLTDKPYYTQHFKKY